MRDELTLGRLEALERGLQTKLRKPSAIQVRFEGPCRIGLRACYGPTDALSRSPIRKRFESERICVLNVLERQLVSLMPSEQVSLCLSEGPVLADEDADDLNLVESPPPCVSIVCIARAQWQCRIAERQPGTPERASGKCLMDGHSGVPDHPGRSCGKLPLIETNKSSRSNGFRSVTLQPFLKLSPLAFCSTQSRARAFFLIALKMDSAIVGGLQVSSWTCPPRGRAAPLASLFRQDFLY